MDWGRHPWSTLELLLLAPEPTGVKERFCSSEVDSSVAEVEAVPPRTESVVVVIFDSPESSSVLMVGIGAELPRVGCRWTGAGTEIGWEW